MVSILGYYWVQKPIAVPLHVILLQVFNTTHHHTVKSDSVCSHALQQHQPAYMVKASTWPGAVVRTGG